MSVIIGGGRMVALAGGRVSLADMGERTTKRASHLEFNESTNEWDVLSVDKTSTMYSHADYDVALKWEVDHFNRVLETLG